MIVDIDFNRVLGTLERSEPCTAGFVKAKNVSPWERLFATERGEITDETFAEALCHDMALPLSYEQFSHGWQAVFVAMRPKVIDIMQKLRAGHRVVVLSNTNRLQHDVLAGRIPPKSVRLLTIFTFP